MSHIFVQRIRKVPSPLDPVVRFGYVTNVYTRPSYRNRGIGTELLSRVLGWAREEHLETLIVWPSDLSVGFYQRAGFRADNDVLELEILPE